MMEEATKKGEQNECIDTLNYNHLPLTGSLFWDSPLEPWWDRKTGKRRRSPWDYIGRSFWVAAAEGVMGTFLTPLERVPSLPEGEEHNEMAKKVAELKKLVETLQNQLKDVSEPLAMVVDAIKKKAMFVNVAEAYEMLQQMNSIFMGYEPWRKNIRPLERFLIREKEKAMVMATPSSYSFIPTDEELADAIISINGKGKALDELQKWLGVCCFVQSCCEYPRDLKTCCERLAALPYKNKLEIPCKFDNVRKIAIYGFVREDYRRWVSYKPNDTEKKNFDSCFDVGKALEKALEK